MEALEGWRRRWKARWCCVGLVVCWAAVVRLVSWWIVAGSRAVLQWGERSLESGCVEWMMMVQWMGSERRLRGGCGCCPCTRVAVAASERGRGEGGASAVEAGQSCSRHQGRHFLWGDKERDRRKGEKRNERLVYIQHVNKKKITTIMFVFPLVCLSEKILTCRIFKVVPLLSYAAVGVKNM